MDKSKLNVYVALDNLLEGSSCYYLSVEEYERLKDKIPLRLITKEQYDYWYRYSIKPM